MKDDILTENINTLSNAVELVAMVMKRVSGNDIADGARGVVDGSTDLKVLICAKIQKSLSDRYGVV